MERAIRQWLGMRVRQLREQRGWSQDVLAELANLNRSYIGAVERAEHNIGVNNLVRIATALDVAIGDLFEGPVTKTAEKPMTASEPRLTMTASVVLHKNIFFQLLKQCANDRPDLVVIYLERCGAVFIES